MSKSIVERLKTTFDSLPSGLEGYLDGQPGGTVAGWQLFTERELAAEVIVDGARFDRWNMAAGLAGSLASCGVKETVGVTRSTYALARMVATGTRNGDYLLVDGTGVFCFYHDGHELELVAKDWLAFLSLEQLEKSEGTHLAELVGIWDPVSSETAPKELFEIFCPVLHFQEDGVAIKDLGDNETIKGQWTVHGDQIRFAETRGVVHYNFILNENSLDIRSPTGDHNCHYERRQKAPAG